MMRQQLVNVVSVLLQCFCQSTFALLSSVEELSKNPDTVDDFFRLCVR